LGADWADTDYEVSVTPKTGNPDLVLSLNSSNKYPDRKRHEYISEKEFSTDSIIVEAQMIQEYRAKAKKEGKNMALVDTVYIGVYT
jgi:hypothetical protein